MPEVCPSPELLRRLLADQLDPAQEELLGDHVQRCPLCQQSLEGLTDGLPVSRPGRDLADMSVVDDDFLESLKSHPPGVSTYDHVRHPGDDDAPPRLPPGYDLEAEIGRGGMGIVYRARQRGLDRTVALKVLIDGARATPRDRDRFRREAEAIARLHHPNIVQIHEIGEHEGAPYLALEHVDGPSLADWIAGRPRPVVESARLVESLALAMEAAHRVGVIHRDLKPSNVLLTASGDPKVSDFGLAKRLDGHHTFPTLTDQFLGTPSYMAPELAIRPRRDRRRREDEVSVDSPSADVYGLGAILYELLTGRPPFRASGPVETVLQVLHEEPISPSRLRPGLPRDLEIVCLKCLEKSPARRYPTARALADDLRRFLDHEPVRARPVPAPERFWRWCRRRTSLALALGLAASAIVAAIGLSISLAITQYRAASRLAGALDEVRAHRQEVIDQSARLAYDHGQAICERGEIGHGLLWLARGLQSTRLAGDTELERAFRRNLSAWWDRLHPLRACFEHPGAIRAATYSPDGRIVAVGGDDATVQLHDARTGATLGRPLHHPARVNALAFRSDGLRLLTGCDDSIARIWDLRTVSVVGPELRHEGPVPAVAFSPDGRRIATACINGKAQLWDAETGSPIGEPMAHADLVGSVAFAPNGRSVATASWDRTARAWDAETGRPLGPPLTHPDWVSSVAYSPDGHTLLTGCYDRSARLWDPIEGQTVGPGLAYQHCIQTAVISPDGRTALTGAIDGQARLWDLRTGQTIGSSWRHRHTVSAVAFAPDGRCVLTCGYDGTAMIREVAAPAERCFEHRGFIRAARYSPDGKTILSASEDRTARLWNAATAQPIGAPMLHGEKVEAIAFAPDGRLVLTGSYDRTARLWDARTGAAVGPPMRHGERVRTVAYSPRGDRVLTGGGDGLARLWNVATGQPIGEPMKHDNWVVSSAFSPDGDRVVTGSEDGTARLWSSLDGHPVGPPLRHAGQVMVAAFSPDGKTVATGSDDRTARLWDVATGAPRFAPLRHDGPVSVVAFRPDGGALITGGWDRTARLWNAHTGAPMGGPLRHEGQLRAAAFSPDGQTLATGSYDRTARLWDAASGQPIGPAFLHVRQVWFVAIAPDGRSMISGGQERRGYLRKVPGSLDLPAPAVEPAVQTATGMELLDDGSLHVLDAAGWQSRRERSPGGSLVSDRTSSK